jgi:hypothetical protein
MPVIRFGGLRAGLLLRQVRIVESHQPAAGWIVQRKRVRQPVGRNRIHFNPPVRRQAGDRLQRRRLTR